MQYLGTISKMKNDFCSFPSKPFSIMVIQIYVSSTNAEEAEVEQFYEDLRPFRTNTQQKMSFAL